MDVSELVSSEIIFFGWKLLRNPHQKTIPGGVFSHHAQQPISSLLSWKSESGIFLDVSELVSSKIIYLGWKLPRNPHQKTVPGGVFSHHAQQPISSLLS